MGENRGELLGAALTILRAYYVAGRPDQKLPAWGSFEGWSGLVRSAVVWVGLPDPGETRLLLQERADVAADSMGVILTCLEEMDPERRGLTAAEIIQLGKDEDNPRPDLRDALEALVGKLDSRLLGNKLRTYRRRVFQGRFIDHAGTKQHAARWVVSPKEKLRPGAKDTHQTHETHSGPAQGSECGESCESFSAEFPMLPEEEDEFENGPYGEGY